MSGLFGRPDYLKCCCGGNPCCPGRCNTVNGEECTNPLPTSVTATLTVSTAKLDPITGVATGCYTVTGTLALSALNGYLGTVTGTCSGWCGDTTRIFEYMVRVTCGIRPDGSTGWYIAISDNLGGDANRKCTNNNEPIAEANLAGDCDPILLTGTTSSFMCDDLACVIPLLGIDEFFGPVVFTVVINEEP